MMDLETIMMLISEALSIPVDHIKSKSRRDHLVDSRTLFVHFAILNGHDDASILDMLEYKNHNGIVQYHADRLKDLVETDRGMRERYGLVSVKIKSYKKVSA